MAILALAATLVVLNAPPTRNAGRSAATDLAEALRTAIDSAIITGAVYRLEIDAQSWRIDRLTSDGWTEQNKASDFAARGGLLRLEIDDAAQSNRLALTGERARRPERNAEAVTTALLDPLGGAGAFDVLFDIEGEQWAVAFAPTGAIKLERR